MVVSLGSCKPRKKKKTQIRALRNEVQKDINILKKRIFQLKHESIGHIDSEAVEDVEFSIVMKVKEFFSFGFLEEDICEDYAIWIY